MDEEKTNSQNKSISKTPFIVGLVVVAIISIGILYFNGFFSSQENIVEDKEVENNNNVVATVNGETISRDMFERQLSLAGESFSEEEILDQMVRSKIFFQEAKSRGISVSDEEINDQYDQITQEFDSQEELDEALRLSDITEEDLKKTIEEQLIVQEYISQIQSEEEIIVSDEEIEDFYNSNYDIITEGADEEVLLEEVSSQIEESIIQQKISLIFQNIIEELYNNADIEIFL